MSRENLSLSTNAWGEDFLHSTVSPVQPNHRGAIKTIPEKE